MLRFQSPTPRARAKLIRRNRGRLWMLILALGVVLASMRQLGQPETTQRIEQLFTNLQSKQTAPVSTGEASGIDLSQVQDKTYFRPEEQEAWFSLFARLQQIDKPQRASETVGDISYAQLLQQPEVYRGHLVTILGKVLREEVESPAQNHLGIEAYHRLWIQPRGGGQWPIVVYCLELPAGFPRGDSLNAPVSVTGFFFKNWSYAYDEGLALAPIVLASNFLWQPPAAQPAGEPITGQNWTIGLAAACVFAIVITWQAMRRTRRRPHNTGADATIQYQLQQLVSRENDTP